MAQDIARSSMPTVITEPVDCATFESRSAPMRWRRAELVSKSSGTQKNTLQKASYFSGSRVSSHEMMGHMDASVVVERPLRQPPMRCCGLKSRRRSKRDGASEKMRRAPGRCSSLSAATIRFLARRCCISSIRS